MLVKKDQKVEDLTFISYRLLCNDLYYEKFIDSAFWPSHVMIGEFIEKPRKKYDLELDIPTPNSAIRTSETHNTQQSLNTENSIDFLEQQLTSPSKNLMET